MVDAAMVLNELPLAMFSVFQQKYPPGAHALTAPFDGRVAEVQARPGAQVAQGALIVMIEADKGDRT